jgi:hypothetical protein
MRINTKNDKIELTKRERQTLADAKALLVKLAKHGDGALADMAEGAADEVGNVMAALKGEPALVPPY